MILYHEIIAEDGLDYFKNSFSQINTPEYLTKFATDIKTTFNIIQSVYIYIFLNFFYKLLCLKKKFYNLAYSTSWGPAHMWKGALQRTD